MEKSRLPRTTVQGPVLGFWEMQDFILFLVIFLAIFFITRSALLGLGTFAGGLLLLNKVDKWRYKVGPGFIMRKLYKVDLFKVKGLVPYRVLWRK